MDRKALANETMNILRTGCYERNGKKIVISREHQCSIERSELIKPDDWDKILKDLKGIEKGRKTKIFVKNQSTISAILEAKASGNAETGVLNFASAKNPGGGFLNGANAQEESLAVSSGLYDTLVKNTVYYEENRKCDTMMYTHHAIYSPDVVFFRDERGALLEQPVCANVITMPAVNYGQVLLKGEDGASAKQVMKERMRLILALFAQKQQKHLILGAYGCGVFRNDPMEVSAWWKELLEEALFFGAFDTIVFAVLDHSKNGNCIEAFQKCFNMIK